MAGGSSRKATLGRHQVEVMVGRCHNPSLWHKPCSETLSHKPRSETLSHKPCSETPRNMLCSETLQNPSSAVLVGFRMNFTRQSLQELVQGLS